MRRILPLLTSLLACSTLAAGCTADESGGVDAGTVVTFDAGLPPSELFGPCVADEQCPGAGARCLKAADGYPGGVCTKPCEDRTFCDAFGGWNWCLPNAEGVKLCVQKCLNGIDCSRDGYTCTPEIAGGAGSCYPVCSGDTCGAGAECNAESGRCVAAGSLPTTLAANGAPCEKSADCRSGTCIPEVRDGVPSGWVGGTCMGPCILPAGWNSTSIFSGDALPAGTCPGNAVCYPTGGYGKGSPGQCYPACGADADCRPGYSCLLDLGSKTFTRSICVPQDCTRKDCPAGYLCKLTSGAYACAKEQ